MSLTNKLSQKISAELEYDEEKSAVISYGIFAFIQILASLSLVALFGFLMGTGIQALIVSFTISILRQYSGGIHATRPSICLIIGTTVTIAIATIVHFFISLIATQYIILIIITIVILSYYLVNKYAPVDSPEKRIKTQSKKRKMKKLSFIVLSIYCICICLLYIAYLTEGNITYLEYAMCICMAIVWQVFTLTVKGHKFITKIDSNIDKVFFLRKENSNEKK